MRFRHTQIYRRFSILLLVIVCLWPSLSVASVDRSGSWYDPTHNGEGFIVQFIDDSSAVIYWFTYDEVGAQRWFTGVGQMNGNTLQVAELLVTSGGVFGPDFNPANVVRTVVGTLSLTFNDDQAGMAEYTIDGVEGEQTIQRLTRPVEVASSAQFNVPRKSGSWYDPTRDGEGFVLEILPDGGQVAYWFTYDIDGNQAWMVAAGSQSAALGSFPLNMLQPVGGRFGPNFDPADVQTDPVGTTRLSLQCNGGYADYKSTDPADFVDIRFNLRQIVGIGPNACSDPALTNLYPIVDGEADIPDHPAGRQLEWILTQLASNGTITDSMINQRFAASWLAQNGIAATRSLLQSARSNYPGARLIDPIGMAPIAFTGVINGQNNRDAFTVLDVDLADGKINNLAFFDYGVGGQGTTLYGRHANLNFAQAADAIDAIAGQSSVVLARIDDNNQCQAISGRLQDTPRATASIFKIWILGGVAEAINDGSLVHDQVVPLDGSKQVRGGPLFSQPAGTEMSIDRLSTLMLGVSDNTATDMLLGLAGRSRFNGLHAEYGHSTPNLLSPQLGISEQFHLFFSFPLPESLSYVDGTESFQQSFLEDRIVPLGSASTGGGGFNHESLYVDGSWQASPMDICGAFARHRLHEPGSDEALLVERALQAQAAQPNVRENWDRVWYKGGSLESGENGNLVLTHAFMLEREGEQPIVVVAMANEPSGGIDIFEIQSIVGRLLELAQDL